MWAVSSIEGSNPSLSASAGKVLQVLGLRLSGKPVDGVVIPPDAVLRYEGKSWIYAQTGSNDFTRTEIPLDRPAENGWFVPGNLTATHRVVVSGAQTVLSAELSTGNFNTGERD